MELPSLINGLGHQERGLRALGTSNPCIDKEEILAYRQGRNRAFSH